MGIVVAKIQNQPVDPLIPPGKDGAERVFLFPFKISFVLGDLVSVEVGPIGVIVLQPIDKPQHNNHQHVGDEVADEGSGRIPRQSGE